MQLLTPWCPALSSVSIRYAPAHWVQQLLGPSSICSYPSGQVRCDLLSCNMATKAWCFSNPSETLFLVLIFFVLYCWSKRIAETFPLDVKHTFVRENWEKCSKKSQYLLLTIFAVRLTTLFPIPIWLHSLVPFALDNVTCCSRSICLWQFCLSVCSVIYVKLCGISVNTLGDL